MLEDLNQKFASLFAHDLSGEMNKKEVVELPLDELRANPYQPRKHFDQVALKELAQSIKENGVFQPIIVRPSQIKGYEIIAGERRFRASQLAQQSKIPAIIYHCDDQTMMQWAVVENLQREDLTPLEEAESYRQLMTELHLTQQELAKKLGKSRPYIANYLRLLTLPPTIKEQLKDGELSVGHARALLSLEKDQDKEAWAKRVIQEKLTVRELERIIGEIHLHEEQKQERQAQAAKKEQERRFYNESERQLQDYLDTKVKIVQRGKAGKIEIDYQNLDELNRLLELLHVNLD